MKHFSTIAIAGAGTMGASMAETFAKYRYNVLLFDVEDRALKKARRLIEINQMTEVSEGVLSAEASAELLTRIHYSTSMDVLSTADVLVEAIVEDMAVKKEFWTRASTLVKETAILASNTSGLSITEIGKSISHPERFLGMHWINPPHIIPLIELVPGEKTDEKHLHKIYRLCTEIDKKPVVVQDAPGFVLNRIHLAILRECMFIAERGIATPEDIDKVMKYALGIRYACLGPFEIADHGGLDVFYNIATYLYPDLAKDQTPSPMLADAVSKGSLGVKTGKGIYDYADGRDKEAIIYRDQLYTKVAKCLFD